MAVRPPGPERAVTSVYRLAFRLPMIRENMSQIQTMVSAIYRAQRMLYLLEYAYRATLIKMGPIGWALLGISVAAEVGILVAQSIPTEREELGSRSPP